MAEGHGTTRSCMAGTAVAQLPGGSRTAPTRRAAGKSQFKNRRTGERVRRYGNPFPVTARIASAMGSLPL